MGFYLMGYVVPALVLAFVIVFYFNEEDHD